MTERITAWLRLRPGEGRPVALLAAWYFCVVGAAFTGRVARDTLFLDTVGADALPPLYVITPLFAAAVGAGMTALAQRLTRTRLVTGGLVGAAALLLAAYALLGFGVGVVYGLYLLVSVLGGLLIAQVWMVASDRFTARDARRVFGLVGAGGTAADIVIGALVPPVSRHFGAASLLLLCVGLLGAAAALATALRRGDATGWDTLGRAPLAIGAPPAARPPGTAHLRLVAIGIVLGVMVVTLVDFQFKAIAAEAFAGDPAAMAAWFGWMSVGTGGWPCSCSSSRPDRCCATWG